MKRITGAAFIPLVASVLVRAAVAGEIHVDDGAPAGGDGTTPARAYRTIREAVTDANARTESWTTIRIAEGTYVEDPNLTITRDGIRLRGCTTHVLDARRLPTGAVESATTVKATPGATVPAGGALLRVHASNVEISGLVFDGGFPRPPPGPAPLALTLLRVDGAAALRSLDGIRIHGSCFQDTSQALFLRLASATISRNFIGRNAAGMVCFAGFEQDAAHPGPEQRVVFEGNRVVDNWNYGTNFLGFVGSLLPPTFASLGLAAAPSVNHVFVVNNDYARNGDARTAFNGVFYPQPIQYSGLVFSPMGSDASDTLQRTQIDATIAFNTFSQNGYGIGITPRVALASAQQTQTVDARLIGNRYCGNAFNALMADFGLIAQSHGTTGAGQAFRYAQGSVYTIDASCDSLTEDDLDYDHPETDPRLPAAGLLGNVLIFNGGLIPPGVSITRPPVLSPGPPPVFAPPVTVPDTTAPEIDRVRALPSVLWPPNGRMVPVWIAVRADDGCDPRPTAEIVSVTSNQPAGGVPDWVITGPLTLALRARRSGGQDRVYTIMVRCTDASGNASMAAVTVRVPHDRGHY